jgi:hypothetical protein
MSSCYAQQVISETNLFEWANGNIVPKSIFIELDDQPSENSLTSVGYAPNTYHSFSISSLNSNYNYTIQIKGQGIVDETKRYELFTITDNNGNTIYKRFGYDPLTTTRWLSGDDNDTNYFRKIDLNKDCFALIFAGWYHYYDDNPGEMIIIIVNRNVATLVYDGNAVAISPTNFDSNCFSMDYVKDAENLRNQETGEMEITPAKLAGRTKYTLYKEGDMLKIREWR